MQHNLNGIVLVVVLIALTPVVADSISEDRARCVERSGGDASSNVGISLQSVLRVLIPEMKRAIRSCRTERAVLGMDRDGIDGMRLDNIVDSRIAMTFEGEVRSALVSGGTTSASAFEEFRDLPCILLLDVLDGASSFNTPDGEPITFLKAADCSCLPVQRALDGFVYVLWFRQVNDMDILTGRGHDTEVFFNVHGIHALLDIERNSGLPWRL